MIYEDDTLTHVITGVNTHKKGISSLPLCSCYLTAPSPCCYMKNRLMWKHTTDVSCGVRLIDLHTKFPLEPLSVLYPL